MNIKVAPSQISTEIIFNGIVFHENLKELNKDVKWLMRELKKHSIYDVKEVFLATLDPSGNLYIDTYEDHMRKITDVGDYKGPY